MASVSHAAASFHTMRGCAAIAQWRAGGGVQCAAAAAWMVCLLLECCVMWFRTMQCCTVNQSVLKLLQNLVRLTSGSGLTRSLTRFAPVGCPSAFAALSPPPPVLALTTSHKATQPRPNQSPQALETVLDRHAAPPLLCSIDPAPEPV